MDRVDCVQAGYDGTDQHRRVMVVADLLLEHLRDEMVIAEMLAANQPGRSSAEVQNVFLKQARELGFRDESKGLFKEYTSALRQHGPPRLLEVPHLRARGLPVPSGPQRAPSEPHDVAAPGVRDGLEAPRHLLRTRELHQRARALSFRLLKVGCLDVSVGLVERALPNA